MHGYKYCAFPARLRKMFYETPQLYSNGLTTYVALYILAGEEEPWNR